MNAQTQPLAIVPNLSSEAESCCNSLNTVGSSCDGSKASDDTPIESLINKRKFLLNCKIPGNDANRIPQCIIDDSICDLCLHFIGSSLNEQNYGYLDSRWKLRATHSGSLWYSKKVFHHYSSSRTLKKSAGAGCKLCFKIFKFSASIDDDLMVLGEILISDTPVDDHLIKEHGLYKRRSWLQLCCIMAATSSYGNVIPSL
jgi:hypothetical protein